MANPQGVVQSNPANNTTGKHIHNYSTFDKSLSYRLYNTLRFGEYTPSFVMEGVPTDEIELNTKDFIDSLSLNAPFKGQIRKIKESFAVPKMAILPRNWDRIYTQPSNGDDVPKDANCVLQNFPAKMEAVWRTNFAYVVEGLPSDPMRRDSELKSVPESTLFWFNGLMRCLVIGEYVYSSGSLLNVCGYKASSQFRYVVDDTEFLSYDAFFDRVMSSVFSLVDSFEVKEVRGSETIYHAFKGLSGNQTDFRFNKPFRAFLEFYRQNPTIEFSIINTGESDLLSSIAAFDFWPNGVLTYPLFISPDESDVDNTQEDITDMSQTNLNLSRLLAYQIVCAHYYTNSSIDVVYTAELYRQYVQALINRFENISPTDSSVDHFEWNGMYCPYDVLSGHMLEKVLFASEFTATSDFYAWLALWPAIFGFRKSLRYGDYFVGSRPRPLAPVNTDVSVNNNMVSVVNITRSIQAQRFANAVMRSRQKIEEYVKSLFGKSPAPDYHNPFFLTRQEEIVFGDEVQNTAESQSTEANSRTANFAAGLGQFTFTFHNDDAHPCIYLQIISFDIRRAYTRSVERQFLHLDRFDMFNPDFQYIGDQPVYGIELGYPYNSKMPKIFAYQSRDMEYKERFDQAAGGFVENLPGWILTDNFMSFGEFKNIDPDFIRSYNTELDPFFLSLTGFSLGSYFHFICITQNNVNAKRPMAVDPQILA